MKGKENEGTTTTTLWQINIDPENEQFLVETNLPTPMTARVYVNLLEGKCLDFKNMNGDCFKKESWYIVEKRLVRIQQG